MNFSEILLILIFLKKIINYVILKYYLKFSLQNFMYFFKKSRDNIILNKYRYLLYKI